jgi:hypothetical protein
MPYGIFPVPHNTSDRRRGVRSRRRPSWLDEQLARGVDPATSEELALRAEELRTSGSRTRTANALVVALGDARAPNLEAYRKRTLQRNAAVRDAANELRALVLRLRDERPVEVQGAALAARLVEDRRSPLHRGDAEELRQALLAASAALDTPQPAAPSLSAAA